MHWRKNAAQLGDLDEERAEAMSPCCLRTPSDDASTMLRTPESVLSRSANACRQREGTQTASWSTDVSGARRPPSRLHAGGDATAAGRTERVHLLWSHCVWLTVRGQGGGQCVLNESACARPEGSDSTDAFVTLLPMGHFSAT